MKTFLGLVKSLRWAPLKPIQFPTSGFTIVHDPVVLEEEQFDEFKAGLFYPVKIGNVYDSKYQVLGKLGFGTTSTVWLARNLQKNDFVSLKVFRQGVHQDEVDIYAQLGKADPSHPGRVHVRTALDSFELEREQGQQHHCLVHRPMWDSWKDMLRRNPTHRFTPALLKTGLAQLLLALDYLHTACRLVHTDIKADNILQELVDQSILESFVKDELTEPSARKFADGATIYASRRFGVPNDFGDVVLSDFGSAVRGDERRNQDAQPNVYRCPEVMLMTEWSYPADIWNVGVMIWDLFEGRHLFYGNDPEKDKYTTRAHLAEVISLLGPPPEDFLRRGRRSKEFFTEDGMESDPGEKALQLQDFHTNPLKTSLALGTWKAGVDVPRGPSLQDSVTASRGMRRKSSSHL